MKWDDFFEKQKTFFTEGKTYPLSFRRQMLKRLKKLLLGNEHHLLNALHQDLRKPYFEAYATEWYLIMRELDYALDHIAKWNRKKYIGRNLLFFPAKQYIYPEPRGCILIIAPWNYPLQLTLIPLIGAIAAGNCIIIKPSEYAPHSAQILADIINNNFDPGYINVVQAEAEEMDSLISYPWNYIFFTGSTTIGKKIMRTASDHLIPLTLELGGKSPCIVHYDAAIKTSAQRIIWGKCINAGQTCIAPDYVLVHTKIYDDFITQAQQWIKHFFGNYPQSSKDYARIINRHHFDHLQSLLHTGGPIICGGASNADDLYIEPTLLASKYDAPIMTEEIFGPLLPIIRYDDINEALELINKKPKPLAMYLFSNNQLIIDCIARQTSSGSLCINDVLLQTSLPNLPFGGVGPSGFGSYRGKKTFDTFTHYKSVVINSFWSLLSFRYPPYGRIQQYLMYILSFFMRAKQ